MGTSSSARNGATAVQKRCHICGIDVASQKRIKDRSGNYYCQPCYGATRSRATQEPALDLDALENLAIPIAVADPRPQQPKLFTCRACGGMFTRDRMDVSSICVECIRSKSREKLATSLLSRIKRYAILIAISAATAIAIFIVAGVNADRSFHRDLDTANDKINSADQHLIEEAKQKDEAATSPPQAEPQPQPAEARPMDRPSRSQLVDDDPVLSSIASRQPELDSALRGVDGASLADSTLRLAWYSNVISYEEYQYAQKFRHSQGDFP